MSERECKSTGATDFPIFLRPMKILRITSLVLLLVMAVLAAGFFYIQSAWSPVYNGEIALAGLKGNAEVYFTEYGVPHIYAEDATDAYRAFGYVHAQDRLWQMDLLRHVGSGRLSELFGRDLVAVDTYLRTLGIHRYAESSAAEYIERDHESVLEVQAYVRGINDYIANNPKPLEHQILGLEVEPFTEQNMFEILAYLSFSFQNAQKTDPVLTELLNKLDSSYLEDLNIYHYPGESTLKSFDGRYSEMSLKLSSALAKLEVPEFIGSNSWVLAGEKTASGKPILANDPHIQFAQPCVWYEAHIVCPTKEYYGYHVAGVPFPLLLHNTSMANGLTMLENDDMDFYIETLQANDPNSYQFRGEWLAMDQQQEIIQVKDSASVEFTVRSTMRGPVVSDVLIEDHPLEDVVTMAWTYTKQLNYTLEMLHKMTESTGLDDTEKALSMHHGPGLNYMHADSGGNIAWWAIAKLTKREDERSSKTFYDAASDTSSAEYYSFDKNPHSVNPPEGYVYTANNQPDTVEGTVYSGYYLPDDRAERIEELLNAKERFTVEDMKAMFADDQSKMQAAVSEVLLESIEGTEDDVLRKALNDWDYGFDAMDFRPLVFQRWIYEILLATQKDELGDTLWRAYQGSHHYKVSIEHLVLNRHSRWWDNVHTDAKESRSDILLMAFEKTMNELREQWGEDYTQWQWGDAHRLRHPHSMGKVLSFLNVGDFPISGGNEVINNMGYRYGEEKVVPALLGSSTRRIIDFADVRNNSWSVLPTGQSGNYFSPHYDDQAALFATNGFRKMMMNHAEIKLSANRLVFTP